MWNENDFGHYLYLLRRNGESCNVGLGHLGAIVWLVLFSVDALF